MHTVLHNAIFEGRKCFKKMHTNTVLSYGFETSSHSAGIGNCIALMNQACYVQSRTTATRLRNQNTLLKGQYLKNH